MKSKSKRFLSVICMIALLASMTACGNTKNDTYSASSEIDSSAEEQSHSSNEKSKTESTVEKTEAETNAEKTEVKKSEETSAAESADDSWSSIIENEVENTVASLQTEYEQLKSEIDSFDKYTENKDKMSSFYSHIICENKNLCIKMCEYGIDHAEQVVKSDMSFDEKYDALEELYDIIYDDAGDDIYDEIYDGILDDMYDDFYDGIIDDAYDTVKYSKWSAASTDEYNMWSDARSDVYDDWSDFRSDIYDFWSDVSGEMWDEDNERAMKKINDFREDVEKLKKEMADAGTE